MISHCDRPSWKCLSWVTADSQVCKDYKAESLKGWHFVTLIRLVKSRGWMLWWSISRNRGQEKHYWRWRMGWDLSKPCSDTHLTPGPPKGSSFQSLFPMSTLSFPSFCTLHVFSNILYLGRSLPVKASHCPFSMLSLKPSVSPGKISLEMYWRILCKTARPCLKFMLAPCPLKNNWWGVPN